MDEVEKSQIVDGIRKLFSTDSVLNRSNDLKNRVPFCYYDDLLTFAYEYPDRKYFEIEFDHIERLDRELSRLLIENPVEWLDEATNVIAEIEIPTEKQLQGVEVRVKNLPSDYEIPISQIRDKHVGKFLQVKGTVSRTSEVRSNATTIVFHCMRCHSETSVVQDVDPGRMLEPFAGCENDTCGKKGPFKVLIKESKRTDQQDMKFQEPLENLNGKQPGFLMATISGELAGSRQPGDKVILTGTLALKKRFDKGGNLSTLYDRIFVINSMELADSSFEDLEISEEEEDRIKALSEEPDIKEKLINCVSPSIYGYRDVKEAMVLQLFSGVRTSRNDGSWRRGDIHLLLVGDPGVAKSQMLSNMSRIAPRCIQTSGRSASSAGLTGAVVKDELSGRWTVDAGAMTLAGEGGLCCVDEVDKMRPDDRAAMHPALEQQSVKIAKAGITADLPTVCSMLGAANPKNHSFDKFSSIISQIDIEPTFLTRMDLIFIILDTNDVDMVDKIANHILFEADEATSPVEIPLLRKYVAYARMNFKPKLDTDAKNIIKQYYSFTKTQCGKKDAISLSTRALESLIRLTEANAKIRLSNIATTNDANEAIRLFSDSYKAVGIDPATGYLDASYLETGIATSQFDKMKSIKSIIKSICDGNTLEGTAYLYDILSQGTLIGLTHENTGFLIKKMSERGEIFTVHKDYYKYVE